MKKTFLLIIVFLAGCEHGFQKKSHSKIDVLPQVAKRVQKIIENNPDVSAELVFKPVTLDDSLGQFNHLDPSITGLDFIHNWNPDPKYEDQLNNSFIAAGVAVGDIDNDGLSDVFLSQQSDGGRLFRNLGGFQFEDITIKSGINPEGMWSTGVTFVDINNDGWLDLFVCGFDSPNRLYINQKGSFRESASEYGLDYKGGKRGYVFL